MATRKKYFSDGGFVDIEREINGCEKALYRFFIKESKKMQILIGLQRKKTDQKWFVRLNEGDKFCGDRDGEFEKFF